MECWNYCAGVSGKGGVGSTGGPTVFCPATRRTERQRQFEPIRTAFFRAGLATVPVGGSPARSAGSPAPPIFQTGSEIPMTPTPDHSVEYSAHGARTKRKNCIGALWGSVISSKPGGMESWTGNHGPFKVGAASTPKFIPVPGQESRTVGSTLICGTYGGRAQAPPNPP